jgi:hypothetical protein
MVAVMMIYFAGSLEGLNLIFILNVPVVLIQ